MGSVYCAVRSGYEYKIQAFFTLQSVKSDFCNAVYTSGNNIMYALTHVYVQTHTHTRVRKHTHSRTYT
jgi:hypothetical protein